MSGETSTDAIVAENDQLRAEVNALKKPLIASLVEDSKGNFRKEDLEKLSEESLRILRRTFESTVANDYDLFFEARRQRQDALRRKSKDQATTGTYNQDTKKWEGGEPEE
jgi:hypothetical protein